MEIQISEGALEDLAVLPKREALRILRKIERLRGGFVGDIKKLHGADSAYRLRSGKYRVLFDLDADVVVIQRIGDRKDIYE